jgi:hypothetical protein
MVHHQRISVSKPRLPPKRRSKGLSCVRGNFHAQFLEGWTGAIPSGYSVIRQQDGDLIHFYGTPAAEPDPSLQSRWLHRPNRQ